MTRHERLQNLALACAFIGCAIALDQVPVAVLHLETIFDWISGVAALGGFGLLLNVAVGRWWVDLDTAD